MTINNLFLESHVSGSVNDIVFEAAFSISAADASDLVSSHMNPKINGLSRAKSQFLILIAKIIY